jgi:hypothetical protein
MGKRHRRTRKAVKGLLRTVILLIDEEPKETRFDHILANLDGPSTLTVKEVTKILKDPGYKENEYGELRSTIRKLTEQEIINRLCAKATWDLHQLEDAKVFAELDRSLQP